MSVTSTHFCCTLSCASLSHPHSVHCHKMQGGLHVHNSRVFSSDARNKVVFSRVAIIHPVVVLTPGLLRAVHLATLLRCAVRT